jgi:hypothetical protein
MGFLCSLMWPLIECYWMCCVYIFSLKNKNSNIELPLEKLIHQVISYVTLDSMVC